MQQFQRGDIWLVNLPQTKNSIQNGFARPVILVNNNKANLYSPVIHAVCLTSKNKNLLPTHVRVGAIESGLLRDSIACCEQTILLPKDKNTFIKKIGKCNSYIMSKINLALSVQFDLV
jgi:mRNA interferase MazF